MPTAPPIEITGDALADQLQPPRRRQRAEMDVGEMREGEHRAQRLAHSPFVPANAGTQRRRAPRNVRTGFPLSRERTECVAPPRLPHVLRTPDQYPRREHQRAADHDLER